MKRDLLSRWLGPKSKYDGSLPYTYEARVDRLHGQAKEPVLEHYFSDTLCGLVEFLEREEIVPDRTRLFAVYRGFQLALETRHCATVDGVWLSRPELCRSLENHFRESGNERYRGHQAKGDCAYVDRNREGVGT
jgi:hypothetical protein